MKEQLYTIPLTDAFQARDECPFCFVQRSLEQHSIDFVLGSGASYMEDDVRAETDKMGFCARHYEKMFIYGNKLGNSLILETHIKKLSNDLKKELASFKPEAKPSLFSRFSRNNSADAASDNSVVRFVRTQEHSCYICDHVASTYARYLDTFFEMYKKDPSFRDLVKNGKGFCLPHFADLVQGSAGKLNEKDRSSLYEILFPQMTDALDRIAGDLDWFQKKFDYQFKDADWKDSKDAVQRAMQKAAGGYPADPPYVQK